MAKFLDNQIISGSIQKMVETAEGYIINGHYYDKQQMIPKPFKLFPIYGSSYDISMSKKLSINCSYTLNTKSHGDTVIVDRLDPTMSYVFSVNWRSNNHRMYKIQENNGVIKLINSNDFGAYPNTYPNITEYCGQDENYLYCIISTSGYHDYMVRIDKNTLVITSMFDYGPYNWTTLLKETNSYIFTAYTSYMCLYMKRYNKVTGTIDDIPIKHKSSPIAFVNRFSEPVSIDNDKLYTICPFYSQADTKFSFMKYMVDTSQTTLTSIATETEMSVVWGSVNKLPILNSAYEMTYETFITTANGNKYLNLMVYERASGTTVANLPYYGIYTFLIDFDANTLTFKSFVKPTTDYLRGFIGVRNNTFLAACTNSATFFMSFNPTTEAFVVTDSLSNVPYHIGADRSENIWIIDSQYKIDYYNPTVPTNINIKYEFETVQYENVDIDTYCNISCKNFNGDYIASNLQLSIKGNAVFTSNNSKMMNIGTTVTGDVKVNLKIKGDGPITINPALIM